MLYIKICSDTCARILQLTFAISQCRATLKSRVACRILVALEDKRLILIEDGKITWARQESLASLTSSIFVELPAKGASISALAQGASLTLRERLEAEFLGIKVRCCRVLSPAHPGA